MQKENGRLVSLAALFLKLGCIAFGGPAAHIAMMQQEVVHKRKWITEDHFLDLLGATNLIPGPNSTEMAIHIGQERAGWKGLLVAGLCFMLPAVIITALFAWLYKAYGALPAVQPFIYGIKPAIIVVILTAIYPLARKALKTRILVLLGVLVLLAVLLGLNEIYALFGAGLIGMAIHRRGKVVSVFAPVLLLQMTTNARLFFIFLKIGAILYGSGYVLFAFLDTELVANGWLTRKELMDAIAVGQLTPGPVFSSVTFIGWQINGLSGALVATAGVFLPSFLFVALLNPLVRLMRKNELAGAFLDAVNVASIAIIAAICYEMAKETVTDWRAVVIAVLSMALAFGLKKLNSVWIVLFGSVAGYLLSLLQY